MHPSELSPRQRREMGIPISFQELIEMEKGDNLPGELIRKNWTYLRHGTNTKKWDGKNPGDLKDFVVDRRGLSVVSAEEVLQDKQRGGGYDTARSYADVNRTKTPGEDEAVPVDVRVVFLRNAFQNSTLTEFFKGLDPEIQDMIKVYYFKNRMFGRHPLVPGNTHLQRIGVTNEDGMQVVYFIPKDEKIILAFKKALNVEI